MSMNPVAAGLRGLLEFLGPHRCVVCARSAEEAPPASLTAGPAPGLRWWDESHLCGDCQDAWREAPIRGRVDGHALVTATVASAALVQAVGAWKYRGLRGLGRPLAALLAPALVAAGAGEPETRVVPVPLHARRRRERGFDQCRQLAALAAGQVGRSVGYDILTRRRATAQQASCPVDGERRRANVAVAFVSRAPANDEGRRLILLDDLVTTGATLAAAAQALVDGGWEVVSLVGLGQAARLRERDRG